MRWDRVIEVMGEVPAPFGGIPGDPSMDLRVVPPQCKQNGPLTSIDRTSR